MTGKPDPDRDRMAGEREPRHPRAARILPAAAVLLLLTLLADDARLRRELEDVRSHSAQLAGRLQSAETDVAQRTRRARVLESDDVRMLLLRGQDPRPGARGLVCWSEKARHGILVAKDLSPLPSDRQYQLWFFRDGRAVDAGVFDPDAGGHALFESKDFAGARPENFEVSIEPRGGVAGPTGPIVLIGSPP